ncbi:flavin reductase, partial [Clostridium botulinum Af84]
NQKSQQFLLTLPRLTYKVGPCSWFFYAGDSFQYKPGAAIVSCRRGGSTAAFDQLNKYFTISNMPIVSSQYWNMVHGNTPEEVKQDLEGMQTMRVLGKKYGLAFEKYKCW